MGLHLKSENFIAWNEGGIMGGKGVDIDEKERIFNGQNAVRRTVV